MTDITFNLGQMLIEYFKKHNLNRSKAVRKMGLNPQQLFYYMKRSSMDFDKLVEFSHGLKHNFLLDVAVKMPKNYTNNLESTVDGNFLTKEKELTAALQELSDLKERLKIIEAENVLLLKVLKVDKA